MPTQSIINLSFLLEASKKLHDYMIHRLFADYLVLIVKNSEWQAMHRAFFDAGALNLTRITYVIGSYVYLLSSHKKSNYQLMQRSDAKRVFYLRGFDYQTTAHAGFGNMVSFGSRDTWQFTFRLGDNLPTPSAHRP